LAKVVTAVRAPKRRPEGLAASARIVDKELRMARNRFVLVGVALALVAQFDAGAQNRAPQYRIPSLTDLNGAPGLSLALRKLTTAGTLMQTDAHPDDENNAMLALYARRLGIRTVLVTATRGDGGQNEIGPELFDALGILRTEELLAAHQLDGAEQYFTRAVDFGYSFSQEETLEKWGHQEILGDFVRHIRTLRPDVIVSMAIDGTGGGQHHQTSGIITAEAFKAAADPKQFPEQIKEGLRPWQAKKLYRPAGGFGGRAGRGGGAPGGRGGGSGRGDAPPADPDAKFATLDTNQYEPLLGCTIGEIGGVASGMHMCQGRAPLVPPPSPTSARYRLVETTLSTSPSDKDETSLFDGIDVSIVSLARFAGQRQHDNLIRGLAIINSRVASAREALDREGPAATVPELVGGLAAVRGLREGLPTVVDAEEGRYEIDFRLKQKEEQFQDALVLAQGLRIDATANDGLIVSGQPVTVTAAVANRGGGEVPVKSITLAGFEAGAACKPGSSSIKAPFSCVSEARVPRNAVLTGPYWERPEDAGRAVFAPEPVFGLPFRPTPFRARIELEIGGANVIRDVPVQFRYDGAGLVGEKRMELKVVPAFAVSISPKIAVLPLKSSTAGERSREVRVTIANGTKGAASATVRLKTPAGWRVTPSDATIAFTREDESVTTRFMVAPPAQVGAGNVPITAEAVSSQAAGVENGTAFSTGYQAIEYPHIQRRHKLIPATATLKVMDVAVAPGLSIGYVMGVGDQVPSALQQLGANVTFIDSDELAWGDLSKYNTIVTGVRAYERRDDLKANSRRLLNYVENGGTVIVQYNKMEFNEAQYGPFAAIVSSNRITDENAPVNVLVPTHPVFTWPNKINEATWKGWVQERGLYFLGDKDQKYVDLVEMEDPFPYNKGPKRGALVEGKFGKGRWVYVGLGLWRQLPAGTDGAYQLMANLVSLGKAK
jgi:LmbE family N-acetylglucosaminyl deacetylase